MYRAAKDSGITLISVSHRPSLWAFHDHVLRLEGGGSGRWSFGKVEGADRADPPPAHA